MKITGTFLDEITWDIPANNWTQREWAQDFRIMKEIGIDTVILIRAGLRATATFPSKVLQQEIGIYPVHIDLVDMFLDLAEENDMAFLFGTYDSDKFAREGNPRKEVAIRKAFVDEAWHRCGPRKAFRGWYLTFEIGAMQKGFVDCLHDLGQHWKMLSPTLPTMISPYI